MQFQSRWTAEQRTAIVQAFNGGASTPDLARRFGVSRAAITGLIHRERVKAGHKPGARGRHLRSGPPAKTARAAPSERRQVKALAPVRKPMRAAPPAPPDALRLPLADLRADQCRFAVTPHDAAPHQHLFCGAPADGGSYCGWHARLAHLAA